MIDHIIHDRYKILKSIGSGGMGTVWYAQCIDTKEESYVAIKALSKKSTTSNIEDIIRFKNEALLISRLQHPNIVKVYEAGETEHEYYIVMEYIDGISLFEFLDNNTSPLPVKLTINFMLQICSGLEEIHNKGLIHKDVKPGNIVIEKNNMCAKLIDFGLTELKEFSDSTNNKIISGTFNYMSPEQIGKLKRSIDERSDLYSVGIIFYELLTGHVPFHSNELHSLIHQHMAKIPEPINKFNPEVSLLLEKIVFKLLEKDPEKRYQSARGLLDDLHKYKNGRRDFTLGKHDKIVKLNYRTNLIGREKQWKSLQKVFNSALQGSGSLCLIHGEAGSGKTRLIEELRSNTQKKEHLFLYAKCFPGETKTPYGPFTDMLDQYVKKFRSYNKQHKTVIKKKMTNAISNVGEIIFKLCPFIKEILGECPSLIELKADRENRRFLMALSSFFCSLAVIEKGLVLVVDDLQWVDDGSLSLLQEILEDVSNFPLLLIGSYRDNEISHTHGIKRIIRKSVENFYPLTKIPVQPFTPDILNTFISSLLYEDKKNTPGLAEFLFKKSQGNPFFTIEIVKHLVEQKIIMYNSKDRLLVQEKKLTSIDMPISIVDILVKRISLLKEEDRLLLSYAATIGKEFNLSFLFELLKDTIENKHIDEEEIVQLVDKAISLQLLVVDSEEQRKLSFTHDRVREACYRLTDEKKRKKLHLTIAATIENINKELINNDISTCDCLFDLAYHYIEGEDKDKILQYAHLAGIKAKNNYANEEAMKYLDIVIIILEGKLLKEDSSHHRNMWIECMTAIGEIYLRIGGNDAAIGIYEMLLQFIHSPLQQSKIYKQISEAFFKKGDWAKCEDYGRKGLKLLGEKLPSKKYKAIFVIIKEFLTRFLHVSFPILFVHNKEISNSETNKIKFWYYYGLGWSYILSDHIKYMHLSLRFLNFTESKIGPSKELGMAMASYGCLLSLLHFPFNRGLKYLHKSLQLRKKLHDQWGTAQTLQLLGYVCQWKAMLPESIDYFKQSMKIFTEIGDMREINMSAMGLSHIYRYISDYDNALLKIDQYYEISQKTKDNMGITSALLNWAEVAIEKGDYPKASHYLQKCNTESRKHKIWIIHCISYIDIGIIAMESDDQATAIKHFQEALFLHNKNKFLGQYVVCLYSYIAEAYLEEYKKIHYMLSGKEKNNMLKKIKDACKTAFKKTKPWITHHASALRVNAKYYALIGRNNKAANYFKNSISLCEKIGRLYELGRCYYEYGKYLDNISKQIASKQSLEKAYAIFKELDAKIYLERTAQLLHIKNKQNVPSLNKFLQKVTQDKRYASLIEINKRTSLDIPIEEILNQVITIALEVTGASCGYIIIKDQDNKEEIKIIASGNVNGFCQENYSRTIISEVFETGEYILTTNAIENEYSSQQSVVYYELKSILAVPIKYKNKTEGVCYLDNTLASRMFNLDDVETLQLFMNTIAFVVHDAFFNSISESKINNNPGKAFFNEYDITNREKEIIQYLHKGNTNKIISEKMSISVRTVDTHIYKIYKKIGVKSRWELLDLINN